jgi:hypothetical protein
MLGTLSIMLINTWNIKGIEFYSPFAFSFPEYRWGNIVNFEGDTLRDSEFYLLHMFFSFSSSFQMGLGWNMKSI